MIKFNLLTMMELMISACGFCITALQHNVYLGCLITMIIIHMLTILILDSIKQDSLSQGEIDMIIVSLLLEWGLIVIQCKILYKYIFLTDIKPILCLYFGKIIAFSNIYLFMYQMNKSRFVIPDSFNMDNNSSYRKLTITFINYSISCQTLTGISSVLPKTFLAELFTTIQVLIFGIGYDIFIMAIAVLRFAEPNEEELNEYRDKDVIVDPEYDNQTQSLTQSPKRPSVMHMFSGEKFTSSGDIAIDEFPRKRSKTQPAILRMNRARSSKELIDTKQDSEITELKPPKFNQQYAVKSHSAGVIVTNNSLQNIDGNCALLPSNEPFLDIRQLSLLPDLEALETHHIIDESIKQKLIQKTHWMVYVKFVYNHMTVILFATQIPRLIGMYFACPNLDCHTGVLLMIGIILDILIMGFSLFCIFVRMSLIQTFGIYVNISLRSIVRAYLTILLLFGLFEFDIFVLTNDMTNPAFVVNNDDGDKFWIMIGQFMFYSLATFTGVGAGDNIIEAGNTGKFLNSFLMLIGIIFNVVIFGVGLMHISTQRMIATEKFVDEHIWPHMEESAATGYLSIDMGSGSDIINSTRSTLTVPHLVYRKSILLRKQGLLPRAIRPMIQIARQRSVEPYSPVRKTHKKHLTVI